MDTQALLLYTNDDKNVIIMYSPRVDTTNALLNWLDRSGIAYVASLPETVGLWCVDEKIAYRVYQVVLGVEDGTLVTNLIYSLQWIEQPINLST